MADFLKAKARAVRSDRYLRALRVSLKSFAEGRNRRPIGSITVAEIEAWLESGGWAVRMRDGYLSDVCTMFNWARRRSLVALNAAYAPWPVWWLPPGILFQALAAGPDLAAMSGAILGAPESAENRTKVDRSG